MKNLFLQCFDQDLEIIGKKYIGENSVLYKERETLKAHDNFWDTLSDKQKEKYREFEMLLGEERLISEENIYLYALKKGFAMGYEVGKEFK